MTGEIDIYGVLFPPLLIWLAISMPISACLRFCLNRIGFYRFVWHRPLFDLAILVIVIGCVSAFANMLS
jgi:hypothetical protein